ncbi:MAG: hypothetical protein AAGA92_02620 [Planctomycetota bacterium]
MRRFDLQLLVLCGALPCLLLAGCGDAPVEAPTSFGKWNCSDGTFECDYPENWESSGGGKKVAWAKFLSGPAMISVKGDTAGSLMAEPGIAAGADDTLGPQLHPAHKLHVDYYRKFAEEEFDGYAEVGNPAVHDCPLGPARLSEFTYSTAFGTGMHGYRGTILGKDKAVLVYCVCPESDWATLKPAFDQVLASFDRGMAEL